jgi:hypothetical protein
MDKLLNSCDFYLIVVPRDDIENLNYSKIINHIDHLSKNSKILAQKYQSLDICFYGYDDDPRELFEIPEIITWMKKSLKRNIPWFYFLSTSDKNAAMTLLVFALCGIKYKETLDKGHLVFFNEDRFEYFFQTNFKILNSFMEKHGLDIELNKKICLNIYKRFDIDFEEVEKIKR